jgi:hypothetical protein
MRNMRYLLLLGILLVFLAQPIYAAGPPWKFSTNEGNTSVSFGFLAQPQYEWLENAKATDSDNNVFLRRFRFIAGGKLTSKLSYFIESDNPNLGKKLAKGGRQNDFYLQDAYVNYAFRPEFQLDGGMLLIPVTHNSMQSAASLLAIDYGSNSFLATPTTRSKVGRDYGLQARGYIKKHYEYRVGVYRGDRNHDGDFPYRYMARFVWYPLEADTNFFYTGTTHGKKKIIALGGTIDRQGEYSANSVDLFIDHPVNNGDAVTFQADFVRYDGEGSQVRLPKQNDWLLEGAYYFKKVKLGPFVQYTSRDLRNPASLDDSKIQGGVAYWIQKHKINVKAGYGKILKDKAPDRGQFVVQTQFFYY